MNYATNMTITHQTVLDEDGNPTAALIPWDEFQLIRAELGEVGNESLSSEWKAELDRRMEGIKDGTTQGIPHDEVMKKVRERLKQVHQEEKQSA